MHEVTKDTLLRFKHGDSPLVRLFWSDAAIAVYVQPGVALSYRRHSLLRNTFAHSYHHF